jgi:hypothetical protein
MANTWKIKIDGLEYELREIEGLDEGETHPDVSTLFERWEEKGRLQLTVGGRDLTILSIDFANVGTFAVTSVEPLVPFVAM